MKKQNLILLVSSALLACNMSYAQTVRVGSVNSGITASGNTLSINNGSQGIQIAGVPPLLQGAMSATKQAIGINNPTATNNPNSPINNNTNSNVSNNQPQMNADSLAKIESAKNNFRKQQEAELKKFDQSLQPNEETMEQKPVRVGQDLNLLKPNIVTNDIGVYNKTTIHQIENKSKEEDSKKYRQFPEHVGKDY